MKKIEALGALKLMSGGSASLAAVDDLHQATGRDLNVVVGQRYNAMVGGDMQERVRGFHKSVAGVSQKIQAPKSWIGSEEVNLFRVVIELIELVEALSVQVAIHKYGPSPIPENTAEFYNSAEHANNLSVQVTEITI